MSDDGTPCYRRMSTPTSAEDLEEAAGLLRDAAGCIQSAAGRMHYMEAMQFGSVIRWCHQALLTISARLEERADGVNAQAMRVNGAWSRADFLCEMSEKASRLTDQ